MRVAICLRGAISRVGTAFTNKDEYNRASNEYVNYKACYSSIMRHIVQANPNYEFDFFIHCWNVDLDTELSELYKPRAALFESNQVHKAHIESLCVAPSDFGGISQALSMKKSLGLMHAWEQKLGKTYDMVILYRPDVFLWKDMNLSNYRMDDVTIYVNAHDNCDGDFHFIMSSVTSRGFANLIDSTCNGNPHALHCWIKRYVVHHLNKRLLMDTIYPGRHQEVLRKIWNFSILAGHLSIPQAAEYGLTQAQLESYHT